jgi:hypothetical protein
MPPRFRLHTDVYPSVPAFVHEAGDFGSIIGIRIALLHEGYARGLFLRPAGDLFESSVEADQPGIGLEDRDHGRNAIDDGLEELSLSLQALIAAAALDIIGSLTDVQIE